MKLSDRLEAVLSQIECCETSQAGGYKASCQGGECSNATLADIGTDHGFIPVEAIRRGLICSAIACDIGAGPLERASEHIAMAGLADKIQTRLGDGLGPIKPGEADIIVIAGMGGMLMKKIIQAGIDRALSAKKLILSPQSDLEVFRGFLYESGFNISSETCIEEEGKYYFIIGAEPAAKTAAKPATKATAMAAVPPAPSRLELLYGRKADFDKASQAARKSLMQKDLESYRKAAIALKDAKSEASALRKKEINNLIYILEGALK